MKPVYTPVQFTLVCISVFSFHLRLTPKSRQCGLREVGNDKALNQNQGADVGRTDTVDGIAPMTVYEFLYFLQGKDLCQRYSN